MADREARENRPCPFERAGERRRLVMTRHNTRTQAGGGRTSNAADNHSAWHGDKKQLRESANLLNLDGTATSKIVAIVDANHKYSKSVTSNAFTWSYFFLYCGWWRGCNCWTGCRAASGSITSTGLRITVRLASVHILSIWARVTQN